MKEPFLKSIKVKDILNSNRSVSPEEFHEKFKLLTSKRTRDTYENFEAVDCFKSQSNNNVLTTTFSTAPVLIKQENILNLQKPEFTFNERTQNTSKQYSKPVNYAKKETQLVQVPTVFSLISEEPPQRDYYTMPKRRKRIPEMKQCDYLTNGSIRNLTYSEYLAENIVRTHPWLLNKMKGKMSRRRLEEEAHPDQHQHQLQPGSQVQHGQHRSHGRNEVHQQINEQSETSRVEHVYP